MSFPKDWDLQIDPGVHKTLTKVTRYNAAALLWIIRLLPSNPYSGDIKKIKGEDNVWRRRSGSYRIFYKIVISRKTFLVFHLERRTSKTY